jgi:surface carbohydrate biosynthesis protein
MRVVISIETKVRELKGKLWLALNLAKHGHSIIIGQEDDIVENIHKLPVDVYFQNSAVYAQRRERILSQLHYSGKKVCVLDTEGGVYNSDEYFSDRLSPEILRYTDKYFAWGSDSAEILRKKRDFPKEKIVITGNPRFDIINGCIRDIYKSEAKKIKDTYGDIILVNTNFTRVNGYDNDSVQIGSEDYQGKLFNEFVKMARLLAEDFPNHTIILRPHPSENHTRYKKLLEDNSRIFVLHYGDARSWIYTADSVIHNSCTTGVESAIMKTPVFSYRPVISNSDLELPNVVSIEEDNYEDLQNSINEYLGREYIMTNKKSSILKKYIDNVSGSATEKIVHSINNMDVTQTSCIDDKRDFDIKLKRLAMEIFGDYKTEKLLEELRLSDYTYKRQKFPGLTREEVENEFSSLLNYLDLNTVNINKLDVSGDVFKISNL